MSNESEMKFGVVQEADDPAISVMRSIAKNPVFHLDHAILNIGVDQALGVYTQVLAEKTALEPAEIEEKVATARETCGNRKGAISFIRLASILHDTLITPTAQPA